MIKVTAAQLKTIAGSSAPLAAEFAAAINKHAPNYGITTPLRMQHFVAHIAHETGGFRSLVENLNYSVEALTAKFSRSRISLAKAKALGRSKAHPANQAEIANTIYGGAWGKKNLGNTEPGDGWRYRGRGAFQMTGRSNYRTFGGIAGLNLVDNPEIAGKVDEGTMIAAAYFRSRMEDAADRDDIGATTKALNGGTFGIAERRNYLARAKRVIKATAEPVASLVGHGIDDLDQPEPIEEITDEKTIRNVQTWLSNIGYKEVGGVDGRLGDLTATAIMAFRAENGLPPGRHIDRELIAALAAAGPRKLSPERENVTPEKAREIAPETQANFMTKVWSGIGAIISGLIAFVNGVLSQLGIAKEQLEPIKDFFGDIPPWAWALGVLAVAVIMFRIAQQGEKAGVEAVATGARR